MDSSTNFITWIGGKRQCYWPGFEKTDYIFYNKLKYINDEFEVGSGAYVPGTDDTSKRDVARIHCLYENPRGENRIERNRAIIELFVHPETLEHIEDEFGVEFTEDIDVVQMSNSKFYNTSIEIFQGRCNIIFALASEDPELVMQRYIKLYRDPIYVCRYIIDQTDTKSTIKCAVSKKILTKKSQNCHIAVQNNSRNSKSIDDDDVLEIEEVKYSANKRIKQYRVTTLECKEDSVKLRIKRQSISTPDGKNNEVNVPIVLLEQLNIDDKSEARKSLPHFDKNEVRTRANKNGVRLSVTDKNEVRKSILNATREKRNSLDEEEEIRKLFEDKTEIRRPLINLPLNEETPSPNRRSSRPRTPVDYKQFLSPAYVITRMQPEAKEGVTTKENVKEQIVDTKSSRRKQNFTHKMYGAQEIEIEVKKESLDTPSKVSNRRSSKTENIDTEKSVKSVVKNTPVKKTVKNTPIKSQNKRESSPEPNITKNKKATPISFKTRNTKVVIVNSEDEFESDHEKSPNLNESNKTQDCPIMDTISTKMQAKLGIVTPQKTQVERPTPQRRRLAKLDEESDEEPLSKTPRKNTAVAKELPTRKSTRISLRNTPRKILVENEDIQTPKKVAATPKRTPLIKKVAAIIEDECFTPKKETPKRKKLLDEDIDLTPKKSIAKKSTPSRVKVTTLATQIEPRAKVLAPTDNPFELARVQLHSTLKPGCLPCREKEFDDITQFINGKLMDNSGGCMYISGVPGTGKTATVCEIMKVLNDGLKKRVLPNFKFISVNALSLTEPKQVYVEIVKQMANKTMHWDEALTYIRSFFLKQKHSLHVMLIDELDKLCTRKQDVVYNLLDLPSISKTPLVVITIANTMDLPERLLSNKVNSRLGLTRLTFRPYKHKELIDIVKARLSAYSNVFRSEALEFVARKVAAVSGDARRALAICSRATEIAEASGEKEITMDIVNKTLTDMISSPKVQAIKSCSRTEQMILQAIAHEVSRTGNDEVPFINIVQVIEGLCILESVTIPNVKALLVCCQKLNFYRLIIMQDGRHDIANTLLLNASPDDIHFALKEK